MNTEPPATSTPSSAEPSSAQGNDRAAAAEQVTDAVAASSPSAPSAPSAQSAQSTKVSGRRRNPSTDVALIATFAAFIAVCAVLPGFSLGPVPITLQTFAVMLAGAVLGSTRGFLAVLLYIAVGLVGLPIFAGGVAGFAVLARPSIGYLVAFPLAAWLIGFIVERLPRHKVATSVGLIFGAAVVGNLVFIWPLGILGMWWRVPFDTFGQAFVANLAFIPGDLIKAFLAALVATFVHRAFPNLLPTRGKRATIER